MKVEIQKNDGTENIIECDYFRIESSGSSYFYINSWVHYIAKYDTLADTVKLYTPRECVDSYTVIKNVKDVLVNYEDTT